MPVVIASGAFDQTAQKTVEIPQLPFFDKLFQSSVVVQRPIPMVVFGPEMLVHHGRYGPQGIFAPFFHVVHMPVVCNDRCLWCLRQCRRSSRTCCPCPCCATTRAHGARDSAGAVHSSICGAHRDVVHSPLEWLHHRCFAIVVTSYSSSADCLLSGPLVLRECLRRDVVWWWFYSWWCLRFCLGQWEFR